MSLYASLAQAYDELFPLSQTSLHFLESLAPVPGEKPASALDAGCATGALALALAERGWSVLGIEPELAMVEIARAKAEGAGLEKARFVQGDMRDAHQFAGPQRFDLVLCLGNTLPHLGREDARRFFEVARSLLAPGGSLVLQLLNYANPRVGPGFAFPALEAGGLKFSRRYEKGSEGRLRFVAELAPAIVATADAAPGGEAPGGASDRGGEVLLTPLEPAWIAAALGDAGFAPPSFSSGWEGGNFDASRDLYLVVVTGPA